MKKIKIPVLCALLAAALTVTMWAGEAELLAPPRSGESGATEDDHVTWALDDTGTLTISGAGEMYDYRYHDYGWDALRYEIISIVVESGVVNIGAGAFDNFPFLETVTIPDSVETIGEGAFESCAKLKTVKMGNGVKTIASGAFWGCYELSDFTLPESLHVIESSAFSHCYALRDVAIPDSVRYMGSGVYDECKLNSISFGAGITTIPRYTLSCDTIKTIIIPCNVNVIEDSVLGDDNSAHRITATPTIYYAGTETQWNAINGNGRADLTYYAERIYFESGGMDAAARFTLNFSNIKGQLLDIDDWGNMIFNVNIVGNIMQPVHFFLMFYDENGKFLHAVENTIKVSAVTESVSVYIGNMNNDIFEAFKTLRFVALDDNFKPYCTAQEAGKN